MAVSSNFVLAARKTIYKAKPALCCHNIHRHASWSAFFRGSKTEESPGKPIKPATKRHSNKWDGPSSSSRLQTLKKKMSVYNIRGYTPPDDVEQRVFATASQLAGTEVSFSFKLDDRLLKFKILTKLIEEFDHPIPNTELSTMNNLGGVIRFFSTPVQDRSTFEDLSKLDLPKNLHIQWEPARFDPETDTFFDGKTAFPARPTVVTSLKYSRKYKGNSGESRNESSVTDYELTKQLEEDYARLGIKSK